jgi:hypothetical protein
MLICRAARNYIASANLIRAFPLASARGAGPTDLVFCRPRSEMDSVFSSGVTRRTALASALAAMPLVVVETAPEMRRLGNLLVYEYKRAGTVHRAGDLPAILAYDTDTETLAYQAWWRNGKLHRDRGPAILQFDAAGKVVVAVRCVDSVCQLFDEGA